MHQLKDRECQSGLKIHLNYMVFYKKATLNKNKAKSKEMEKDDIPC